ncbi:MAG: AsmA family protein [Alphaproteobacteria bacterium]|nr:AsmA family protein [Alphaproteobacteria bacterium]
MKWVVRIGLGLLVLVVVAVGGALAFIATLDKTFFENQAKQATGRDLSITALDLNLLSMTPSVSLRGLAFENAVWSSTPYLATVESLDLSIKLTPLFSGVLDVERLILNGAEISVEFDETGRSNLDFDAEDDAPAQSEAAGDAGPRPGEGGGAPLLPILRLVDISDVTVTISDASRDLTNVIAFEQVSIRGDSADQPLDVRVIGTANDLPLVADGQLGAPDAILDPAQSWPVNLAGDFSGIGFQVDGAVQDPARGAGVDVVFTVSGEELADAARLARIDVPTIGAFDLRGELIGDAETELAIRDLNIEIGSTAFVRIEASGGVAAVTKGEGVALDVLVQGLETAALSPVVERFTGETVPALGPYNISASINGGQSSGLALSNLNLALGRSDFLVVNANGSVADLLTASGVSVGFALQTPSIAGLNPLVEPYTPQPIPDLGALLVQGVVTGGLESELQLSDLNLDLGGSDLVRVTATGGVSNVLNSRGLDLVIRAVSDQVGALSPLAQQYAGQEIPALGPLDAAATVVGDLEGVVRINDLSLSLGDSNLIAVTAAGVIENVLEQRGINLALTAKSDQIAALSPLAQRYAGQDVPTLGPLDASATIFGDLDGAIGLRDLSLALGGPDLIAVTANGAIEDIVDQRGINLALTANSDQIGALSPLVQQYAGQPVPALGPLDLSASITGDVNGVLALSALDMTLGGGGVIDAQVTGGVADLAALTGLDLRIMAQGDETADLTPIVEQFGADPVPAFGPFSIQATVRGSPDSAMALEDMAVNIGAAETARLSFSGAIADVVALSGVDVGLAIESPNLANASTADIELPPIGPIELRARATGTLSERIEMRGLTATIGSSDLAGDLVASIDGERPRLDITLNSNRLDTEELWLKLESDEVASSAGGQSGSASAAAPDDGRVIPDDPLPFELLRAVDVNGSVKVATLQLQKSELTNAEIGLSLNNGDLKVSPLTANAAGGLVTGDFALTASQDTPSLNFSLQGDNLDIGGVMLILGTPGVISGPLTVDVSLSGLGRSPREIAGSLDGFARVLVANGQMNKSAMIREYGEGVTLVTQILFANREDVIVECLIADTVLENGVVKTQAAAVETEISTITVDGDVDLGQETLDLDVVPRGSIAGSVNLGVPVAVGGTFTSPSYRIRGGRAALGVGLGFLTGGVAPAVGALFAQKVGVGHPCRDMKVQAAPTQPVTTEPAEPQSEPASPEEAVRGLLEGLLGD